MRLSLLAGVLSLAAGARAEEKPSPEFEQLRTLAGEWVGTAKEGGSDKSFPAKIDIRLASAGSVVVLTTDPGGAHEMVTVFHRDDGSLVATHYCAAMNQPRMRLQPPTEKGQLAFEFFDGTNLGSHPGHMQRLELGLGTPGKQTQRWTFSDAGKLSTMELELHRTKGRADPRRAAK